MPKTRTIYIPSWMPQPKVGDTRSVVTPEGVKGGTVVHDHATDGRMANIIRNTSSGRADHVENVGKGYYEVKIED